MAFTVEIKDPESAKEGGSEVQIHLDPSTLDSFIKRLIRLRDGKSDHLHFMSESWGLGDLTEEKLGGEDNALVHHLRVVKCQ